LQFNQQQGNGRARVDRRRLEAPSFWI
jgi:hypothetical protein